MAQPMKLMKKPAQAPTAAPQQVGAAQVFGRLPQRPVAPEAPGKVAAMKKKKMGATEVFGRGR